MKKKKNVKDLINAFTNRKDELVQRKTSKMLGEIEEQKSVSPLIRALKEENHSVRQRAAETLDKLGWKPEDDTEKAYYLRAKKKWSQLMGLKKSATIPLVEALEDEDFWVQAKIEKALTKMGIWNPKIYSYSLESREILEVIWALGEIRDERAVAPLIQALRERDSHTQEKAAKAIVKIGQRIKDLRAVKPLMEALIEQYRWKREVRMEIAKALGKIGEKAVKLLVEALKDEDWKVRQGASIALGSMRASCAVEDLIGALNDEYLAVAEEAHEALGKITGENFSQDLLQWQKRWEQDKKGSVAKNILGIRKGW